MTDAPDGGSVGSEAWVAWRRAVDLDEYEARFDRMAAEGGNPHGEVDFVMRLAPRTALDAGCGFGRVAIELHARGVEVVGVDLDPDLLDRARRRAPGLDWRRADLSRLDLDRRFDLVVLAGNVLGFAEPTSRADAFAACAAHVDVGGHLVIGTQLRRDWPTVDDHRRWAERNGLDLVTVHADWEGAEFADGDYAVLVFARPSP